MTSESPITDGPDVAAEPVPASPQRRRMRWYFRVPIHAVIIYSAWCATLYFYQDKLLFPADMAPTPYPGEKYDLSTIVFKRHIDEGDVVGWLVPAAGALAAKPAPLVIFCHGNAEIIDDQARMIVGYQQLGFAVLLPEYRGYGRSAGTPSERGIVEDAVWFFDQAIERPEIDAGRIVIHGRSLGGGVAAGLADQRRPSALVLESTFTSAAAMARTYFAPGFLVKNPFHVDDVLRTLDVPTLVMHGSRDDIIPVAHGRMLKTLGDHVTYIEFDCRHNDFPGDGNEEKYWKDIGEFLVASGVISEIPPARPLRGRGR